MSLLAVGVVCLSLGAATGFVALTWARTERTQVSRSLAAVQAVQLTGARPAPAAVPFAERVLLPALQGLAGLGARLSPAGAAQKITGRLDLAGNPTGYTVERILALKGAGLLAGGLLGVWLGHSRGLLGFLLFPAALGLGGFFLPNALLYNIGEKRQDAIRNSLPDSLDLLTISVEAGLGFDAALAQVARNTDGPFAGELFRLLQEMQIGKSRTDAFRALGERSTVEELKLFVSSIVQADTLGIPISNVLREQSKEMRLKRMQRAEEKAQKVPIKILFPTVICILPAMFVVIIGPGAISIGRLFGGH